MIAQERSFNSPARLEKYYLNPVYQVAGILVIDLLFIGIDKLSGTMGAASDPISPWIITTAMVLFFSLFNSILSLKAESMNKYWGRSIIGFMVLLVLSAVIARLFSGLSMDEAGSFRWLFLVLTMGYLIFLAIVRTMKRIVQIAIKQDKRLRNEE